MEESPGFSCLLPPACSRLHHPAARCCLCRLRLPAPSRPPASPGCPLLPVQIETRHMVAERIATEEAAVAAAQHAVQRGSTDWGDVDTDDDSDPVEAYEAWKQRELRWVGDAGDGAVLGMRGCQRLRRTGRAGGGGKNVL